MINILITFFVVTALLFGAFSGSSSELSSALANAPASAVELVLQLAGSMAFWGGIMQIAVKSGLTEKINTVISRVLVPLFPDIKRAGKAMQAISMNVTANLLGLGNAATPLGIAALKAVVSEEQASSTTRSMAMLILLNTASVQLISVTVSAIRAKYGAASPWDCTLPIIVNSACALLFGIAAVSACYRRRRVKC